MLTGCINDFINPAEPQITGKPPGRPLLVPVLDTLFTGVEEPNQAFSNATDIEPGDLVPDVTDYQIGPNDVLDISIFDLMGEGTGETVKTVRVTETGMVSLPFIAPVKANGLTERQLESAIAQAYQDARMIRNARVSVTVSEPRARLFSIQGNVGNPGQYVITQPDFRMLDALVAAKGPTNYIGVDYAYIIRKLTPLGGATTSPSPQQTEPEGTPSTQPGDLLAPPSPAGGPPTPQGRANPPKSAAKIAAMDQLPNPEASRIFRFDDLSEPSDVRIIRVPIDELRQYGELKYNVVIRPNDMIIVPDPTTGFYYMGGHVGRPGVYNLTGIKVTLKQAWVAAGGGDDFAIPSRSELIRRIGTNQEACARIHLNKIMNLEEPDIYLKPNDVVYVGTNIIASFLAAIRNSFRITYGFGFLYDQNFYTGPNGF